MIDAPTAAVRMIDVGPEDRALLRSNPSAGPDARTETGVRPSRPDARLSWRQSPTCPWPQSGKPRGSGGRAPVAVGHMSRSTRLRSLRSSYFASTTPPSANVLLGSVARLPVSRISDGGFTLAIQSNDTFWLLTLSWMVSPSFR